MVPATLYMSIGVLSGRRVRSVSDYVMFSYVIVYKIVFVCGVQVFSL